LLQEKFKEAKDAFVTAMNLGVSEGEIASYMAEISYFEKNYTRIAYWMQKIPAQSLNYQLYSLRSVWMDER
jgi:predicted type IV restriction endonuclease